MWGDSGPVGERRFAELVISDGEVIPWNVLQELALVLPKTYFQVGRPLEGAVLHVPVLVVRLKL